MRTFKMSATGGIEEPSPQPEQQKKPPTRDDAVRIEHTAIISAKISALSLLVCLFSLVTWKITGFAAIHPAVSIPVLFLSLAFLGMSGFLYKSRPRYNKEKQ
jgi:hypothetical protein